jgi:hypothetical protein
MGVRDKIAKAIMDQVFHVTPTKNVPQIMQQGLVPQLGERAVALGENAPAVYTFPSKDHAVDAVTNWLGDHFPESEPLALLGVTPPAGTRSIYGAGFERSFIDPIPPANIKMIDPDFGG